MTPNLQACEPERPWDTVKTFYDNSKLVAPRPTAAQFHLFPALPSEIRLQIWAHAISLPRLVELEDRFPPGKSLHRRADGSWHDGFHYCNKLPPPMLSTCSEAREEALKAYGQPNTIAAPVWIRLDYDIVHMKDLAFASKECKARGRWHNFGFRKWNGKPELFSRIRCLAIHRELQLQAETVDDLQSTIRHFFPNLELLIILIDDTYDIRKEWKVKKGDTPEERKEIEFLLKLDGLQPRRKLLGVSTESSKDRKARRKFISYEDGDDAILQVRRKFWESSTGSFYDCKVNRRYEKFILTEFQERYDNLNRYKDYESPMTIVMGAGSYITH